MNGTGRNDRCPCGSGKRYKHCHGALDAGALPGATSPASAGTAGDLETPGLVARALSAHQRGDLDAAERAYRSVLARVPEHPQATHYLGVAAYQRGQPREALPLLERSVVLAPTEPEFHNNLGLTLAALARDDDAIAAFRKTLARNPAHATAWNNLGLSLHATHRMPEAIAAFREALQIDPGFVRARWNLALALLAVDDYREGWRAYEARLEIPELGGQLAWHAGARWDGTDPSGKRVLVLSEQGLGDTLQFTRFATALAQRGARVIVEVPPSLTQMIASVPGVSAVFAKGTPAPPFDVQVPLLSLPYRLGIDAAAVVAPPYVTIASERRAVAAAHVARIREGRLAVGLAWAGNRGHLFGRLRSPPVESLLSLFGVRDVAWFSLQKGPSAQDFAQTDAASALVPLALDTTFDDDAALIDALELVISVDTSIAHLAGALAKPAWIMLPFAADWRWGVSAPRTPWYPTARLFRQPQSGDWRSVVDAVVEALTARVRDR